MKKLISLLLVLALMLPNGTMFAGAEETEPVVTETAATEEPELTTESVVTDTAEVTHQMTEETEATEETTEIVEETVSVETIVEEVSEEPAAASVVASGTCGDNLTWTLDHTGQLTISGEGEMDYFRLGNTSWSREDKNIKTVQINSGVTSIVDHAFQSCSSITEVEIPDSVTTIGKAAFHGCSNLTEIVIPKKVISIGNAAFNGCSNLTEVVIPKGVTSIDAFTFNGCSSLTEVVIPNSVTSIGESAFRDCNSLTELVISGNVTNIGAFAFCCCSNLTEIVIPERVTDVGWAAFADCRSLTKIVLPGSIRNIGGVAFQGCSSLIEVSFIGDAPAIDGDAFYNVTATAYYPADNETWTNDVKLQYGGTITWIPHTAEHIHEYDDSHVCECGVIGGACGEKLTWVFDRENGKLVISGTGDMYNFDFSGENSNPWRSFVIDEVVIEPGVTNIGQYAFTKSPECNIASISIPDTVTRFEDYAFYQLGGWVEIYIPSSVKYVGKRAFSVSAIECITVDPDNDYFMNDDAGALLTIDGSELLRLPPSFEGSYVVPDGVILIREDAFQDCGGMTQISIPDSVTSIGETAFHFCTGLHEVILPANITVLNQSLFSMCENLTKVTLPEKLTTIGLGAFHGCAKLLKIEIPENVTYVDDRAFGYCKSLERIIFKGNAPVFHETAFENVRTCVMYPTNNPNWTDTTMLNYGGTITWKPYCPDGHTEVIQKAKEATCTETGLTEGRYCSACGEVLVAQETIPAKDHTMVVDEAVAATCTEPGKTQGVHCSACGKVFTAQNDIPAQGHEYENATCIRCGAADPADITGNGQIDEDDAVYLLWHTLYPDLFPLNKAVDFNGDGEATAADAVFLLWHSLYPKEYPLG